MTKLLKKYDYLDHRVKVEAGENGNVESSDQEDFEREESYNAVVRGEFVNEQDSESKASTTAVLNHTSDAKLDVRGEHSN